MDEQRRKRINRLKKIIMGTLITAILLPYVFCGIMAVSLFQINKRLQNAEQVMGIAPGTDAAVPVSETEVRDASANAPSSAVDEALIDAAENLNNGTVVMDESKDGGMDGSLEYEEEDGVAEIEENGDREPDSTAAKRIYLTFDDGPSPNTGKILDVLKEYGVKATFFVVGREDDNYKELYKRIVDEGHTLGMHSFTHIYSQVYASLDSFQKDFEKEQDMLYEATGVRPTFYRFPGGSSNHVSRGNIHDMIDYLEEKGVTYFDWNIASGDSSGVYISADQIVNNVLGDIKDGPNVILLHDAQEKSSTVEALPKLIEKIGELDDVEFLPITDRTEPVRHKIK